ncbi:S-adenosyl-L-methionine-dependent methyltransferase [Serendipita vermifera]|nr:S-adenosyl-L-methionine-dependent methyltransferase [Serendipita vermifera]
MANNSPPKESARYDQAPPNYSQAGTTMDGGSSVGNAETASEMDSVYSYYSFRDMTHFLKNVHGRQYNVLNDAYFLPSDDKEWERLDKQHVAFVIGMKGLVPCPEVVDACLRPLPGITRHILDLGCGTGVWTTEMARVYPHAYVVGVDLAPVPIDASILPSNCRFEVDDVNLGLEHFYGQYDVVHARLISSGIKNYRTMMEEAEKCLKPGGVVIFIDHDAMFCAEDQVSRQPMAETNENGSWLVRCSFEMRNGAQSDLLGMEAALDEGLWNHELIDTNTAQAASMFLPIGPWPRVADPTKQQLLLFAGVLMRQDYTSVFRALLPIFTKLGVPKEVVEEWRPHVEHELAATTLRLWARTRMAWGRRRTGPGEPAPPIPILHTPQVNTSTTGEPETSQPDKNRDSSKRNLQPIAIPSGGWVSGPLPDYKLLHIYNRPEELKAAVAHRVETLGKVPVPWVLRSRAAAVNK